MATLQESSPPVNPMTPNIDADRLRRDHGLHRAAQLLADASRIRQGLPAMPLVKLHPDDREWFKQTARHAIEVFELVTQPDREPDADREKRQAKERQLAQALESRLQIERSAARVIAKERGHDLGPWHADGTKLGLGDERACCRRCSRMAYIDIGAAQVLSGSALSEGCLTAAPEGDPRR